MDKKELLDRLNNFKDKKIGILGDFIIDEYIYGNSSRVSREAPVLILKFVNRKIVPGGGGNAAANIASLSAKAVFFGYADNEPATNELIEISEKDGIDTSNIIRTDEYLTPLKTRILAGGNHSTKQQVVRIDKEKNVKISTENEKKLIKNLKNRLPELDGVIISDYGSGTVSKNIVRELLELNKKYKKIIAVDSRYDLIEYRDITLATPNEWELRELFGKNIRTQKELIKYGIQLKEKLRSQYLIVTQGSSGMTVFDEEIHKIPIVGSDEVADVTGCGDTVIATATIALSNGFSALAAAKLSNHAGGVAVTKRGTAPVLLSELKKSVQIYWT